MGTNEEGALNRFSGCSVSAFPGFFFLATFLKSCGRGKGLRTTMCIKTVVGGKQGHALCKILLLNKASLLSVKFNGDHKTAAKMR